MDIEIDFVFGAAIRTIANSDTVRQDLHEHECRRHSAELQEDAEGAQKGP
jgi:hypothetical protein